MFSAAGNQTDRYLSEYIQGFQSAPQQDSEHLRRVLQYHFADLSQKISAKDILPKLTEKKIIQIEDNEKILAIEDSQGGTMATVYLLFMLHRYDGGWGNSTFEVREVLRQQCKTRGL